MPLYSFKCPSCGRTEDAHRKVDERDDAPLCPCGEDPGEAKTLVVMKRQFTAAGFQIEGRAYIERGTSWFDKGDL